MDYSKFNFKKYLFFVVIIGFMLYGATYQLSAQNQKEDVFETFTDDFKPEQQSACAGCPSAKSCESGNGSSAPPWLKFSLLTLLAAFGGTFLYKKYNWKIAGIFIVVVALGFIPLKNIGSENTSTCSPSCASQKLVIKETAQHEFQPLEQETTEDEFQEFVENDEFQETAGDEFQELSNDEFSELSDETTAVEESKPETIWANRNFTLSILVLFLTMVSGILVRFKTTRKLKTFMLLGSIIYLGFINGACPCMISSFQNTIMYFMGIEVKPILMLWFLGLIPLTYFFGKVWCGWVCHLGALQEFIFRPGIIKILQDRKSQLILKWVRIVTLVILIAQIVTTRTNIFIHYDPFKVAFNLFSANTLGYVLLVIMLISSALIYRPFCRAFCPIGLILGWVSHIPGAAKLSKNDTCIDCKSCSTACNQNAMIYENKKSILDNEDCILCGDCMDTCKFSSLEIKGIAK